MGPFWIFLGKNLQNKIFSRNMMLALFKLGNTQTSSKKTKNFYEWFWRKTPNKQTNIYTKKINKQREGITKDLNLWVQ